MKHIYILFIAYEDISSLGVGVERAGAVWIALKLLTCGFAEVHVMPIQDTINEGSFLGISRVPKSDKSSPLNALE